MMLKNIKQRMSEAEKVVQVEGAAGENAWASMAGFGWNKDSTGAIT